MEIEAQDYINAITAQRNELHEQVAMLRAYVAKLERKVMELITPAADPKPE
jgi:hypothetical protein